MKVGITGAGGNIGRTLRKGLKDTCELTLFDMAGIARAEGPVVRVDFAERAQVEGKFEGLDAIIHLAGNPWPNVAPAITLRNNFEATSYAFEEARRAGVRKIVYASSNFYHQGAISTCLRSRQAAKITLEDFPTPECYYAQSKVYGESLGRHLAYGGMQFVALRIGWTVPEDSPAGYDSPYMRAVFISQRDLIQAVQRALDVKTTFMAAFAVSNNTEGIFDLAETRKALGFEPQDNASARM